MIAALIALTNLGSIIHHLHSKGEMMDHKQKILDLKSGEMYLWPESDYGKAEIWRVHDIFVLFEIPNYGGEPVYEATYHENYIDGLVAMVNAWT